MASEITQRQRAEAEVEKLLEFIEATAGRKLRFRPICNLNTGKQESPSERLAGWYEKIVATARQEALREARETVLAEVLEDIPNNEADEAYNMAIGHAAHALDRLASEGG